ncbi:MAG: cation acetate symporter [Tuberibacillus sp.]
MNLTYFLFFLFIVFGTIIITYWAAQREKTTRQFYTMSGSLTGMQNGFAIAGDFMSAASFLGVTGSIALKGFDGFVYSLGFLVSFMLLMFVIAEPIHNLGKYTLADVVFARFPYDRIRILISCATMIISILYMIPQLVAAGLVIHLLLQVNYNLSVIIIGTLMVLYVVFGGMMAASWVQIVKTILLLSGTFLLVLIILSRFHWNFFELVSQIPYKSPMAEHFFLPGHLFDNPFEALSLNLTLVLGTAALPHILVRFYTVRNRMAVRQSVLASSWFIGLFYLMTLVLGLGVVVFVGSGRLIATDSSGNLAAPLLAYELGGDFLTAFISAVAFATILAVVTGLVVTSTTSFAYDIYNHTIKKGRATEREQIRAAKISAAAIGILAIVLSLNMKDLNVTFLVSLTFSVAASIILPVLVFTLFWRRFNATGAVTGMVIGFTASFLSVIMGPAVMDSQAGIILHRAIFPLENPGIITIPLGFLGAIAGTILSKEKASEGRFRSIHYQALGGYRVYDN